VTDGRARNPREVFVCEVVDSGSVETRLIPETRVGTQRQLYQRAVTKTVNVASHTEACVHTTARKRRGKSTSIFRSVAEFQTGIAACFLLTRRGYEGKKNSH
jgi:hypothetical protein